MSIRIPEDITRFYKYELDEHYDNLINELDRFLFMKNSKSRKMYLKEIIPNLFQGVWNNFIENETLNEIYLQNDREIFHLLLESYMYSLPHPTKQKKVQYKMNANKFIPKSKKKIVNNEVNGNEKIIDSSIKDSSIDNNKNNTQQRKLCDLNKVFLWNENKEMKYSDTIVIKDKKRIKNEEIKRTKSDNEQMNNEQQINNDEQQNNNDKQINIFEDKLGIILPNIHIPIEYFHFENYDEVEMNIYEIFNKKFPPDWLDFDNDDKVIINPETNEEYFRISCSIFDEIYDEWYSKNK